MSGAGKSGPFTSSHHASMDFLHRRPHHYTSSRWTSQLEKRSTKRVDDGELETFKLDISKLFIPFSSKYPTTHSLSSTTK